MESLGLSQKDAQFKSMWRRRIKGATIGYSKENLKIHTGSLPSFPPLPSPSLAFPSLSRFPSLPISTSLRSRAP